MINDQIIITDDYGNKLYEIHEDGVIYNYTTNQVLIKVDEPRHQLLDRLRRSQRLSTDRPCSG